MPLTIAGNLRWRYVIGLSAIALLMTTSFLSMQHVISKQRDFARLVNLAGHQAGLTDRIVYFAGLMADTNDEAEFENARSQIGLTMHKMKAAHKALREGDPETQTPKVINETLKNIYEDPMMGLDMALERFLERAGQVYDMDMESLSKKSIAYIYLINYGPHALEPLLDAVVEEYERIGRASILKIERFELFIWLAGLLFLLLEAYFIFRPLEKQVRQAFGSLKSSVAQLTDTRHRLVEAQKLALIGHWEIDTASGDMDCSDQVYQIAGRSRADVKVSRENVLEFIHPEDQTMVRKQFKSFAHDPDALNVEYRVVRPDGAERLVYQKAACVKDRDGNIIKISGMVQDITQRKELSNKLDKLSRHIPGFIFQLKRDKEGDWQVLYVSSGVQQTCGITPEELYENSGILINIIHENDRHKVVDSINASTQSVTTWKAQYRVSHPQKGDIWLESHATPERMLDGGTLWHGYIWDITIRRQAEDRIRRLALYDSLTGLANRQLFLDRLSHAVALAGRKQLYGAVLMLDLDNFKSLNDTRGHDVGDALLVEVGRRLSASVRETDTVARLGGDEFVILLEWLGSDKKSGREKAMAVAEKTRKILCHPYILGEERHVHYSSTSVGVTLFHGKDQNESQVLKRADVAMYEAKDRGRNRICLYSEERQAMVNSKTAMAMDMKTGLDHDEFRLFLQPQVSKTGVLCGAEALLRWFPPDRSPVSPAEFIPMAESTGLILPLGEWVLKQACIHAMNLEKFELPDDFAIAVNISALQFGDKKFIETVKRVFDQTGAVSRRLKFELTETSLVQDMDRARSVMEELRNMGLGVELDDFGTGYSSLNSIKNLPLTALKLDASLINDIETEETSKAIVRAALAMAQAMTLQTVAEGVETQDQMDFLVGEGCDIIQGYLFAKPMPYDDFVAYAVRQFKKTA